MEINQYGLSRTIPDPVKRIVRQRCGFGCVNCGNAIYQYEHLEPTFAEAKEHNAEHIVLLCGGCHDRVSRRILSKETIKKRALHPRCKQQGFSFGPFDLGEVEPIIQIGTVKCQNVQSLIQINGESLFSILNPECDDGPFRINAFIADRNGEEILRIVDNEWATPISNWDVEVVGPTITIRKDLGDIVLIIRTEAPHTLIVERLEMVHRGIHISCREGKPLEVTTRTGQVLKSGSMEISDCLIGFDISDDNLAIGCGGGNVYIGNLEINSQVSSRTMQQNPKIQKIGRNAPCPCGSGSKYKKCCGVL